MRRVTVVAPPPRGVKVVFRVTVRLPRARRVRTRGDRTHLMVRVAAAPGLMGFGAHARMALGAGFRARSDFAEPRGDVTVPTCVSVPGPLTVALVKMT